ncbi:MAG: ATP-binding cassette domain-containing protein [Lachnospiraceae bacterium]|nr:ATP-binding cassette domain-containing protein [Lachnospiraceae bacterium]
MLDVLNIAITFNPGTVNEKVALSDVSFHLDKGEFVTIVGSNGAGKSTLFNAISGTFMPDKGAVVLDGRDITYMPDYKRSLVIGRLFQDPLKGTAPKMSIEENLTLASKSARGALALVSKKEKDSFREYLEQLDMGLENRMKSPVGLLSGGQRQALTLLMATMVTPKILLLDEHTAALDPGSAAKVLDITKRIVAERNLTCMMVTHNMNQALELGNRTFMMNAGKIILDIKGEERAGLTVDDLLQKFAVGAGEKLNNDEILLSKAEK